MRVLVFSSRDSCQHTAAVRLAQDVGGQHVDRLSNDLADLKLVVQHGVVEPVVIVILDAAGGVKARIPRLLTAEALRTDLDGLA